MSTRENKTNVTRINETTFVVSKKGRGVSPGVAIHCVSSRFPELDPTKLFAGQSDHKTYVRYIVEKEAE